ncbi:hypothetical protein MP965_26110 [Escherichia coli]|nr:hypothetical protein [Escherichia coli]
MKIVLLSLLVAVVLSQPGGNQNVIDDIHGFRVEYDDRNDIVIFVSNDECYIIEAADATWDSIVRDQEQLHVVVDEIYAQFTAVEILTFTIAMKIALVLLVLLPLAFARPQLDKRQLFGVDMSQLRVVLQDVLTQLGSDPSEQQCEASCHQAIAREESTLHLGCDLICASFQALCQLLLPDQVATPAVP